MHNLLLLTYLGLIFSCTRPQLPAPSIAPNLSKIHKTTGLSQFDCQWKFTNSKLCLHWKWETLPTDTEYGSLIVRTYHLSILDNFPILESPSLSLKLELFMPSMNHGSSPTNTTQLEPGTFKVQDIFFVHAGHWELRFQLVDPENHHVSDTINIPYHF
jgi:hypothetical protein